MSEADQIPEASIARLPGYLRALIDLDERGVSRVSSTELAQATGVQSALLRRDLSHFGSYGTRGVGYEVELLIREIGEHVGTGRTWPVVVVGVGNLGRAVASHLGVLGQDFRLVALADVSPDVVGDEVCGVTVGHQDRLPELVADSGATIGIIATPAGPAQQVCDQLIAAGVHSILNFAPTPLVVPEGCTLRTVDLSQELHILAFHEARRLVRAQSQESAT